MLMRFDPELVGWLMKKFSEIGEVQTGTAVEAIEHAGSGFRVRAARRFREGAMVDHRHRAARAPDAHGRTRHVEKASSRLLRP
jgi:hypothetical protein